MRQRSRPAIPDDPAVVENLLKLIGRRASLACSAASLPANVNVVENIFQTCNTFLRANAILFAGEILGQLDYEEKEVKPYKPHELKALFQAADETKRNCG